MKAFCLAIVAFISFSCSNEQKHQPAASADLTPDTLLSEELAKDAHDTVIVYEEEGAKSAYTKNDLKKVLQAYPLLKEKEPVTPDSVYITGPGPSAEDTTGWLQFGGEAGQDEFYLLYGYFTRLKEDSLRFMQERKKLIDLFRIINQLEGTLAGGGTGFGHNHIRIVGLAEYALFRHAKDSTLYSAAGNFQELKTGYLQKLKQKIQEAEDDILMTADQNAERKKEMQKQVALLENMITDDFYLLSVIEFHKKNYQE